MDAKEFLKCFIRYCNNTSCDDCVMIADGCYPGAITDIDRLIDKVEQWCKNNPIKTRKSEFLKKFPDAYLSAITRLLPCSLDRTLKPLRCAKYGYLSITCRCDKCRDDYWNEELTNDD